jgi:hypothetical protein
MMKFLLLAGLLATSVVLVFIAIRTIRRRRPLLHSGASAGQLGSVSQHWLTTHRAER